MVTLSAPTSGDMSGILMFSDRNADPAHDAFTFNGGSTQNFTGALYLPKGTATYTGGSTSNTTCVQLVADKVNYGGNAVFSNNCTGKGTRSIGGTPATLVE